MITVNPETDRDRIFEAFFTTRDRARNAGLDLLAIARNLAHERGGRLVLQEVSAGWTRFTLDIPLEPGEEAP